MKEICPEEAMRILKTVEMEQDDRHRPEDQADQRLKLGPWPGILITLLVGVILLTLYLGYPEPSILVLIVIITLAIYTLKKRPKGIQGEEIER